jgi:hypothetical protein
VLDLWDFFGKVFGLSIWDGEHVKLAKASSTHFDLAAMHVEHKLQMRCLTRHAAPEPMNREAAGPLRSCSDAGVPHQRKFAAVRGKPW